MKILVCISKTPDTTAKIAFTDNNTKFASDGVQYIINPYDEWYSLVRAIELKEKDASIALHLVTVGGADADHAHQGANGRVMKLRGGRIRVRVSRPGCPRRVDGRTH